jgi:outer membrane lipoprotein
MRTPLSPLTLAGLLLSTLLLNGCFKPPAPLAGTFAPISVTEARGGGLTGKRVRWGGVILSTTPGKEDTCFEILARPLNSKARPRRTDESKGRFIACAHGFYDPAVYSEGRDLTVVGTLQQPETHKIGEHEYEYPKVAAERVYLWPHRTYSPTYYYYPGWTDWYLYPGWALWPYNYSSPLGGPWPYGVW